MPKRTPRRGAPRRTTKTSTAKPVVEPEPQADPTLDRVRGHVAAVGEIIARLSRGARPTVDDVRAVRHAVVTAASHRDPDGLTIATLNGLLELGRRCRRAVILIGDAFQIEPDRLDASATSSAWLIAETRAGVRTSPEVSGQVRENLPESPASPEESPGKLSAKGRVIAALTDHPGWSDEQIAKSAGVSRTSLYRMPLFKKLRKGFAGQRADLPRGTKSADGDVEAFDD